MIRGSHITHAGSETRCSNAVAFADEGVPSGKTLGDLSTPAL